MEAEKKKLKVYCETSFWSWLVSRPSTDPDHAVKQAWTRKWWEEAAVFGMDILLTWNCRHMANMITLPKTVSVVVSAGYECLRILTPKDALEVNYD